MLRLIAVICLLGFYGCMRPGEISKLLLNDVEKSASDIYINIHWGKTPSAKRNIPFGMMTPAYAVQVVSEYFEFRRNQFGKVRPSNISLFGPELQNQRYNRNSIIRIANLTLKSFFGSTMTMHQLRHCGCSWLYVRMAAAKYPNLRHEIVEEHHELFSPEYTRKTVLLFSGQWGDLIPIDCNSSLTRLAMNMGHLGLITTFRNYVHSFHIVQKHAMDRASTVYGLKPTNGRLIAALIPKMKSPSSRAKLKGDVTMNELLALARERLLAKWPKLFG